MNPPDAKNSRPVSTTDAKSASVVGPEAPRIVSSDVFISRVEGPLTPEQRRERIEAVLKFMGLPPLDEFNRIDAEAYAAANKDPTEPRG
jgi:hypothetical protein